eukprot:Phypoly_transcript_06661.p1 GENE.Phypoly_transcript_06661~~Phypoly_transcript_06661.p1  ORF type:complete len:550 (+),score=117.77 Phypoly_transcript_06661:70-1719(+)
MTSKDPAEPRALPRALLLKVSLPTEGITKTVLVGLNATLADVREKLIGKLSSFQIPPDINNWAFMLTKNIDQMWLDDKVFLKAYNVKDGDLLEFKRKARVAAKTKNLGPWVKAAPKSGAIYEHQLDRPASPDPRSLSPAPGSPTTAQRKTSTDKLFDAFFEKNKTATSTELPRPPTSTLSSASTSGSFVKPRRNSTRRKSNALVSLLTKSTTKNPPKSVTPTVKPKQKINSTESPFTKTIPIIATPPAVSPISATSSTSPLPPSTSPVPPSTSPQPTTPKQKKDEITEEEMLAWLEMEENEMKGNKQDNNVQHDVQEISLDLPSHLSPRSNDELANHVHTFSATATPRDEYGTSTPRDEYDIYSAVSTPRDESIMNINARLQEIYGTTPRGDYSATSTPRHESDSHPSAQGPKLTSGYIEKSKSSPNTPRMVRSDSVEDGYVHQQVEKFDPSTSGVSDFKERKARRRSRTGSDARLSMMIKKTAEMEQQFNTYIETLTESLDKNEKTLDTVQALLYQMIKRIDEGNLDLKGARRYAKNALDVMLAAAKK